MDRAKNPNVRKKISGNSTPSLARSQQQLLPCVLLAIERRGTCEVIVAPLPGDMQYSSVVCLVLP